MLSKHLQNMTAGCLALSIATIALLSSLSSNIRAESTPLWEGHSSKPTANNINPIVAQGNFNSEARIKAEIENSRWNQFTAPDKGVPGRREGGGTRGPSLTALVPQTLMGRTVSASPTFYYHVSTPLKNSMVEFEMADENDNTIYKTTFNMNTAEGGIFNISIPDNQTSPLLEVGQTYRLYLTVKNADGSFLDLVTGWVKRVELNPSLMKEIEAANLEERLGIYDREAIWYDALATLGELRRSNPDDIELESKWNQILKEVKLEPIAKQPLLQSQLIP
jgi:hypothetical protein